MPLFIDEEQESIELEIERRKLAFYERDRELARKHEQEMAKLKLETIGKNKRGLERIDVLQRTLIALIKLPTLPIVLITIAVLVIANREVHVVLQEYISL